MRKYFITVFVSCSFATGLFAQQHVRIHGQVIDEVDAHLVEATIQYNKDKNAVISDTHGFDIIITKLPDTLSIMATGYSTKEVIINKIKGDLTVRLHSITNKLEDVVINTGYQHIPKERSTGSFYFIDSTLFNQRVGPNVISRLDGITSSLLIDNRTPSQTTYQIRGLSTLTQSAMSPLIILDNFPYSGDINNINPNDVESISVLKDAAASSIWGAMAGNGVIVITTKRARKGQPMRISVNGNITMQPKPNLFSAFQIPTSKYIELERFLFENGYYTSKLNNTRRPAVSHVVEILNQQKNGTITEQQADEQINSFKNVDIRHDMERYLYHTALNQQYAVSVSGSSSYVDYLFSAGFDNDKTTLIGNGNNRFTLRSDNVVHLTKKWNFNPRIIFTKTHTIQNSPGGFGNYNLSIGGITPYSRLVNPDGTAAALDIYYRGLFTDTAGSGQLLDWKFRPIDELNNNDNYTNLSDLLVNFGSNYKISSWLSFSANYQYESSWTDNYNYHNLQSYYTRDLINQFTDLDNGAPVYNIPKGGIMNSKQNRMESQSGRAQLDVDRIWQDKHQLFMIVGGEIRDVRTTSDTRQDFGYDNNTLTSVSVDYTRQFPTYDNVRGMAYIPDATYFTGFSNRFVSLYSNASYTYNGRYILSGSIRKDASNFFGVNTNQKWVPLWSVGGAWRISKERFYNIDWLTELKVRATYGFSGNLDPNASALTTIGYFAASRSPIKRRFTEIMTPANPDLRWERVKQLNLGLDFAFVNNRATGSIEYFTKKSVDLMNAVNLDPVTGFSTANMNSASINGHGIDITLNTLNIDRKVKWRSIVLFSYISYKVIKNLSPPSTDGLISSGSTIFPVVGYNPYIISSYKFAGLDPETGDPIGYVNGEKSKNYYAISQNPIDQQVVSGQALPPYFGTLRNTIEWKGFSLAANIIYKFDYYFRKPSINYYELINYGEGGYEYENRWQKPGDEKVTNIPSIKYPINSQRDVFYNESDINVEPADNVKLTDIYFDYHFIPESNIFIKGLTFYCYLNNLNWTIWKKNNAGLDPDVIYNIKPPHSFSIGLKADF